MAESVVSFVVQRIGYLLNQEAVFLARVSAEVLKMKTELQRMQFFLQDADNQQDESMSLSCWVSEIRELAYDAENIIESFALQAASRRFHIFETHKVNTEIKTIKRRITSLTTSLTTYGIQTKNIEPRFPSPIQQLRRSYSNVVQDRTVGLDNDVKILVEKLRGKETCGVNHVVSIFGMGGLGKTTLARTLYHHVKIRDHFQAFAWYCVSQQFQPREVWEGILFKLVAPISKERREEISKMKDDEIAKELYLLQQKMKCLVVLDDVWREDAWDLLKAAFPIGKIGGGSKILMTSRNKTLAFYVDPSADIYELQFLNEQDSWELFRTALYSGFKFNMDMEELGMQMVKKCSGLPLAIIVLAGLLSTKNHPTEWEKVHKLFFGRIEGNGQKYSVVDGVLALSYNQLPYHLKSCFLHLGNFPEDYDIPCKTLLKMWVAEGFVSQLQDDETMEDVAERYLDELVDRSIVQVSRMGSLGRVKTCRLHDVMRDFCLTKANQENYLQIVRTTSLNDNLNSKRIHRLVVHPDKNKVIDLEHYAKTPHLRSLLLFMSHTNMKCRMIKSRFSDFKLLKILSFENCRIGSEMGKEIGGLIHLRYLAFEDCLVDALPSSIGNLRYLQTLIIRPFSSLTTVVSNIVWKLGELRHLILGYRCDISGGELLKLGNMIKLQILECRWVNFSLLNSTCPNLLELSHEGIIRNGLPEFPLRLTKLTLRDCCLYEDPMPILEKLPNLRILRLDWDSFEGRLLVCSSKGFPQLKTLLLKGLNGLEEWKVNEEAMPNLCQLHINSCRRLKMIPEGIKFKFITTLRQLKIKNMSREFEVSCRWNRSENLYNLQHVPSIIIVDCD